MTPNYLLKRLREPSTWAAIAGLLVAFGVKPELAENIQGAGIGLASLAAILLPEQR